MYKIGYLIKMNIHKILYIDYLALAIVPSWVDFLLIGSGCTCRLAREELAGPCEDASTCHLARKTTSLLLAPTSSTLIGNRKSIGHQ